MEDIQIHEDIKFEPKTLRNHTKMGADIYMSSPIKPIIFTLYISQYFYLNKADYFLMFTDVYYILIYPIQECNILLK